MNDLIYIIIATVIVAAFGCPFVEAYSKWKKIMKDADAEGNGESGDDNVQNR